MVPTASHFPFSSFIIKRISDAAFGFAVVQLVGVAERDLFEEDGGVAGDVDVLVGDVDEPEVVVAEGGACTEMEVFVPPVEDVAFGELVGCMVEYLASGVEWVAVEDGHDVLQLVAEASGTAYLVEACACEEAGGVDLVEVPTVEHEVETAVGGLDLNGGEFLFPVGNDSFEFGVDGIDCLSVMRISAQGLMFWCIQAIMFVLHFYDEGHFAFFGGVEGKGEADAFAVGVAEADIGERFGGGEEQLAVVVDGVVNVAHRESVGGLVPFGEEVAGGLLFADAEDEFVYHVELYFPRGVEFVFEFNLVVFLHLVDGHEESHVDV